MTLLFILFALGAPVPPPPNAVIMAAPVTREILLVWDASPSVGCSNVVYWGYALNTMTNRMDAGTNTTKKAWVFVETAQYFKVRAVLNGLESVDSNIIVYPPKQVDVVYAQRDGKDIGIVDSWTNPPARPAAQYRLRIQRTEDYRP